MKNIRADENAHTPFRGSALKQLKMSVRDLMGRSNDSAIDSKKILTKKALELAKKREKHKGFKQLSNDLRLSNPFDTQSSQSHFNVLNRKIKGLIGHPGRSHRRNLKKRYEMLGKELDRESKKGGIIDNRIKEFDPTVPPEEKARSRLIKENMKAMNKNIFDLEDNTLTHLGQSLSLADDYDEGTDDSETSDPGNLGYDTVSSTSFGGFKKKHSSQDKDENEKVPLKKSHSEIMEGIIRKSKMYKEEKRLVRLNNAELIKEVDEIVDTIKNKVPRRSFSLVVKPSLDNDHYDSLLVDLMEDGKSNPTDPLLTSEQSAALEAKFLENLEKDRLMKIAKEFDLSVQNPDSYVDFSHSTIEKKRANAPQPLTYKNGILVNAINEEDSFADNCTSEESEFESVNFNEDLKGDLYCEPENVSDDSFGSCIEGYPVNEPIEIIPECNAQNPSLNSDLDLPYTFEIPQNLPDTISLFSGRTISQCEIIIQRIKILYSTDSKLQQPLRKFSTLLIDYIYYYYRTKNKGNLYDIFPIFCQIVELGRQYKTALAESIQNKSRILLSSLSSSPPKLPSIADYLLFPLIRNVYGDGINNPLLVLNLLVMCKFITQKTELSYERIYGRLWIMEMLADFVSSSNVYIPELIYVIGDMIDMCVTNQNCYNSTSKFNLDIDWTMDAQEFSELFVPLDSTSVKLNEFLSPTLNHIKNIPILIFLLSLKVLIKVIVVYSQFPDIDLALSFITKSLKRVPVDKLTAAYRRYFESALSQLETLILQHSKNKPSLKLQCKFKNAPIKMETPKFFDEYSVDPRARKGLAAAERQKSKLMHLYKKEKRGAIRDLRRDASVINNLKAKKKEVLRDKYNQTIKTVIGQLSQQEGEERALERKRKRSVRGNGA